MKTLLRLGLNTVLVVWLLLVYKALSWLGAWVAAAYTLSLALTVYVVMRILVCSCCNTRGGWCPYGFSYIAERLPQTACRPRLVRALIPLVWLVGLTLVPVSLAVAGLLYGALEPWALASLILAIALNSSTPWCRLQAL